MATMDARARWGGGALMLGVAIFLASRFRDVVTTSEAILWLLIPVGFAAWIAGVAAFRARYRDRSRVVGRAGLSLIVVGVVFLAVGHVGLMLHLVGPPAVREVAGAGFVPVLAGTLLLVVGTLAFGADAVRGTVLARLRAAPLITGLIGLAWMVFAFDSRPVEGNPEAFLAMRTLFGLGWLVLAVILFTDRGRSCAEPPPATEGAPPWRRGTTSPAS